MMKTKPNWSDIKANTLYATLLRTEDEAAICVVYKRDEDLFIVMENRGPLTQSIHFQSTLHATGEGARGRAVKEWGEAIRGLMRQGFVVMGHHITAENNDKITDLSVLSVGVARAA